MTDDEANLQDLHDAEAALIEARQALTRAIIGGRIAGEPERKMFLFKFAFARGRLGRIWSRTYVRDERCKTQ